MIEDAFPDRAPVDYPALIDRLEKPLAKFISGYVRDAHATEDLVQETFLRVVRNLHRYRGQASVKTWVFTIARNLCLDYLRAAGRTRLRLLESLEATEQDLALERRAVPDSLCPEPSALLERDERRDRVGRALNGLPAEARNLLVLRLYLDLSYREIAAHCRVKPAGVGTRIARARRRLAAGLG